jgi:hypothetical protein
LAVSCQGRASFHRPGVDGKHYQHYPLPNSFSTLSTHFLEKGKVKEIRRIRHWMAIGTQSYRSDRAQAFVSLLG